MISSAVEVVSTTGGDGGGDGTSFPKDDAVSSRDPGTNSQVSHWAADSMPVMRVAFAVTLETDIVTEERRGSADRVRVSCYGTEILLIYLRNKKNQFSDSNRLVTFWPKID